MKLFRRNVRFVVPRFQRPYVWSKELNWEPLWDDVLAVMENIGAAEAAPAHFLGAVVLDHQRAPYGTTEVRQVIDGQQRLSTLQLLIAAARDVATELDLPERYVTSLRRMTLNDDEMSVDPDDTYKVWPTNADRAPFRDAVGAGSVGDVIARYPGDRPTIVQAYLFFVEKIREWAESIPPDRIEDAFERLVQVFHAGMFAVVIDLDGNDNPQVIFETLNARGTPLQASDLVRNHLFHAADRAGLAAEELYDEHWARFDDGYWREDVRQGRLRRPRMDAFLAHFLTMELALEVSPQQLFLTFRSYLKQSGRSLPEAMAQVGAYGDIYSSLDTGEGLDGYERAFVQRLGTLDTTTVIPVLLRIFHDAGPAARRPILEAFESYLLRRMICGLASKNYNRLMLELIRRLPKDRVEPHDVVDFLAQQQVDSNYWPSDRDVHKAVTTRPLYQPATKRDRLRMVLDLIDGSLQTLKTEYLVRDLDDLTVEHLMPQLWQQHWPLRSVDEVGRARETRRRRELLHTLGNLTLTTNRLNASLSNGPWVAKRRAILESSALNLNRHLPEIWDEDTIVERGRQFAESLCRLLPRPQTTADAAERPEQSLDSAVNGNIEHVARGVLDGAVDDTGGAIDDEAGVNAPPEIGIHASPRTRRSDVAKHIQEVLRTRPPGTVMTVSQLSRAASSEYPVGGAGATSIRNRLKAGTVSGVRTTTDQSGYLAAALADPLSRARKAESQATVHPSAPGDLSALEARFHHEMVRLHSRARDETGHDGIQFLRMLTQRGGLRTVKLLLRATTPSESFRALLEHGRGDLTAEAAVLRPDFGGLFTDEDRTIARDRLAQAGWRTGQRQP
jgi:hypothetical protein